jgi:glucoamylase
MTLVANGSRCSVVAALLATLVPVTAAAASAPDGPGALSHFDLARKDCLGTARNTTSRIWYTVAGGVLSDVYAPTADTTQVETMQLIVTDGSTFTDLQSRDTTYAVTTDLTGMTCTVTSTARSGAYRIVTTYVTDPDRGTVLARARYVPLSAAARAYRLYVRLDASAGGNGGGGAGNGGPDSAVVDTSTGRPIPVTFDPVTATNASNRDYAVPSYLALRASRAFGAISSGFVGAASDGLVQLDATHQLAPVYDAATEGNVEQTAALQLDQGSTVTLALGFGTTQAAAVANASASLARPFDAVRLDYEAGWLRYDLGLRFPAHAPPGVSLAQWLAAAQAYYRSANVVKASEDKTFAGAIVAALASPWGQAISAGDPANTYFGSYREVFARDLYEAWTGLMADGDVATARAATLFLFQRQQQPDGSMPRNSLLNGKLAPDTFGVQLDEASYPLVMAAQLGLSDAFFYQQHVKLAADFVAAHGPSFGAERWEEQSGFSPSTIAAEIAGLLGAADLADANHDAAFARVWRGVADDYQRSIKGWAVTTNGPLAQFPYFIRLSKTGDPNAAISYNVGNGGTTLDQRTVIDAGFLELTRLGILSANDADVTSSLSVVDATIESSTASGPGWHRYNGDGYGDRASDGRPWAPSGQGTGHLWPVLSAERAEQSLQTGDVATAFSLLDGMTRFASGGGLIPEQDWELPDLAASPFGSDPTLASIGFVNGKPAGSAAPLTWSAAAYVRLFTDIGARRLVDQPANTVQRYLTHTQGQTSLAVTSPPDQSAVSGTVTVSGTSVPGNTVDVLAVNIDGDFGASVTSSTAAPDGSFTMNITVTGGTTALAVVATSPDGATAHVQRTVVFDFVPGTKLLDVVDADGDDNGPGNYAYPTSSDFKPGAFDLEEFQLYDDGTNAIFRVKTRDLTPTFGSPLGAQLVDVYVHDPNASVTSTAASFTQRNYSIAPASAWSRLVEVQGFGQRYIDAGGATLGTVDIRANAISRFITFSVPKSSLGQPASGWGFVVVLTGQDGFSPDQARSFASTPQPFQFGVCAAPSNDPHCTFDPNLVPKAMDVITPLNISQATELDYTLGSVVLVGVTMP